MRRRAGRPALAVAMAGAAYAGTFSVLSILKQDDFGYGRFDLGNMAQTAWNTAHGRVLEISDSMGDPYTRLGVHVDPVLAAFAPLFRIWPEPKLLLVAQAAIVAAGAWPAFRLARAELAGLAPDWAPAALAGAFLAFPALQWATLDEFHPVTLAAPLLLFAIWLLRDQRYGWFAVAAIAAALCKEEVGLLVGMIGLYAAVVWGDRRLGLVALAAGFAWSLFAFEVVIPHYTPFGGGPFADRYDEVGGGVGGILGNVFTDPLLLIRHATDGRDLGYVAAQLGPLLLLPLLAPAALLVALPELAINVLSSQEPQSSIHFHYAAPMAPIVWWAALLGVRRLLVHGSPRAVLCVLPLAGCLVAGYLLGPLPWWSELPGGSDTRSGLYSPDAHDAAAKRVLARVPDGAPISVANTLGAHIVEHRRVAVFPDLGRSRYVAVDLRNPALGEANGRGESLAAPIGRAMLARLNRLRTSVVAAEDGVVLLRVRGQRPGR